MEWQDEELLARYVKGETQALGELVGRYRRGLYSFILRKTGNAHDADELFQDVWLKVMHKAGAYRAGRFRGWLFRLAHNMVIDRVRSMKVVVSLDGEVAGGGGGRLLDRLPDKELTPEAVAARQDVAATVRKAVGGLAAEQRDVFLMRTESGLSFKEIARIQKVPVNTALARMHYAVMNLRKVLSGIDLQGELA